MAPLNTADVEELLVRRQLLEEQQARELHDLDIEADRLQVLLEHLRLGDIDGMASRVEDRLAATCVALGERARPAEVGCLERIDALILVSGLGRRQVLVGRSAGERSELTRQRSAVDGEVDRLPQLRVVPEEWPARVEDEHGQLVFRPDEELRLVDAVALFELACAITEQADAAVELAARDLVDDRAPSAARSATNRSTWCGRSPR